MTKKELKIKWEDFLIELFRGDEDEVVEHYYNKELYKEFTDQICNSYKKSCEGCPFDKVEFCGLIKL